MSIPGLMTPGGFEALGFPAASPAASPRTCCSAKRCCWRCPTAFSAEHAALTEPFAVGEHAVVKAESRAGSRLLVVGCGPVGLAVIASLKARGLGPVIAADFSPERRAAAELMGADR